MTRSEGGTLSALLTEAGRTAEAGRPFLVSDGAVMTYGELNARIMALRALFRQNGIGPGRRVGILAGAPQDMSALFLAGLQAGFAVLNINTELAPQERVAAVRAARLDHLFADADLVARLELPTDLGVTTTDAIGRPKPSLFGRLLGRRGPAPAPVDDASDPQRTALMLYTSGTTNQPKVVELGAASVRDQVATFRRLYGYGPDCRILNPLPLHFTDGLFHGPLTTFLTGATLYRPRRFEFARIGDLLDTIASDGITHFIAVPALLALMSRLDRRHDTAFRTPAFRYIRSSGDRLPEALWRRTEDRFGVRVTNAYGLSETVCEALYSGPGDASYRRGTVGKPIDCEARIIADDGAELGDGDTGELVIRGSNVMTGYLGQPELTRDAFADGWFRTGDLARRDADGFYTIVGRRKTLIVTGGVNVQPQEVADVLLDHPAVAEAHVLGLPDPDFNEIVGAAVVLNDGGGDSADITRDLIAHCRTLLAPQKVPRRLLLLDRLPRNPAGKVLDKELLGLFAAPPEPAAPSAGPAAGGDLPSALIAAAAQALNLPSDALTLDSTPFNTPGWDSLAHLGILASVETRFGIKLESAEVMEVNSVADLLDILERHDVAVGQS